MNMKTFVIKGMLPLIAALAVWELFLRDEVNKLVHPQPAGGSAGGVV